MLAIPLLLPACVLLLCSPGSAQPVTIGSGNPRAYGSSLMTVFTAFRFFPCTRAGKRIVGPGWRPRGTAVEPTPRAGLWASSPGVAFSHALADLSAERVEPGLSAWLLFRTTTAAAAAVGAG